MDRALDNYSDTVVLSAIKDFFALRLFFADYKQRRLEAQELAYKEFLNEGLDKQQALQRASMLIHRRVIRAFEEQNELKSFFSDCENYDLFQTGFISQILKSKDCADILKKLESIPIDAPTGMSIMQLVRWGVLSDNVRLQHSNIL
jgi:hypothetical protein